MAISILVIVCTIMDFSVLKIQIQSPMKYYMEITRIQIRRTYFRVLQMRAW